MLPWADIDTVLLDMDGTLIDLRFDNHLWNSVVPTRYARLRGIDPALAVEQIYGDMPAYADSGDVGALGSPTLDFYDIHYWARRTGLDMIAIHEECSHLVRYRRGAADFMAALRRCGRRSVLATNAHPDSVGVKDAAVGILGQVDMHVNAHTLGAPKEDDGFWNALARRLPQAYRPERTLLIDDNEAVLAAAQRAGVKHLLTVAQPDSSRPPRTETAYAALRAFADIMPNGRAPASDAESPGVRAPRSSA